MFETTIAPVKSRLLAAGVQRLGVFGSLARGEARKDSDVDVLVTFRPDARKFDNLYLVGEALEQVFCRRADLVTEDSLSPYIGSHIRNEIRYVELAP